MQLRKLAFVLPNLFTCTSIFFGLYSLTLSAGEPTSEQLYKAALAIFVGLFFDLCDGRVARLTKTQSDFGLHLDSLADVITFGVAPALLLYKWALAPLGMLGLFFAFLFACCGALRLARFNVLALRGHSGSGRFFTGLPIPLAAGMVVSVVIAHHRTVGADLVHRLPVVLMVLVLSYLMVSNVPYRTFKEVRITPRSAGIIGAFAVAAVVLSMRFPASLVLVGYFGSYIAFGLMLEIVRFGRRRALRAASAGGAVADVEDDEETEGEERYV